MLTPVADRIRELDDGFGARLRLSASHERALLWLERSGAGTDTRIDLDLNAADLLASYLFAVGLTGGSDQPPERGGVLTPVSMELVWEPEGAVRVHAGGRSIDIPGGLWERVYAELKLALASVRSYWLPRDSRLH